MRVEARHERAAGDLLSNFQSWRLFAKRHKRRDRKSQKTGFSIDDKQ